MFRSLLIVLGRLKETRNKLLTENTVATKIALNCKGGNKVKTSPDKLRLRGSSQLDTPRKRITSKRAGVKEC